MIDQIWGKPLMNAFPGVSLFFFPLKAELTMTMTSLFCSRKLIVSQTQLCYDFLFKFKAILNRMKGQFIPEKLL